MARTGYNTKAGQAAANKRYYARNKGKRIAKSQAWKKANKDRVKGYRLAVYGITLEQYNAMLLLQDYCCASCGQPLDLAKHTHQDHCHKTNKARGIICNKCNLVIGLVDDLPDRLIAIANYLRGFL